MSLARDDASSFHRLHVPGQPLILFNAWDVGSAKAVVAAGAKAIATGSWSMAAANGYEDGERLPLDLVLAQARAIVRGVELPVSVDFEAGFSPTASGLAGTIGALAATGAAGCNLEDGVPGERRLRDIDAQRERLMAAREAAPALFINARTDVFLLAPAPEHAAHLDEAIARVQAYASAGVDGVFVPGLADETLIRAVVQASSVPVNVMAGPGVPPASRLATLGVARVSHGPGPYLAAMAFLRTAAAEAMQA